MRNGPNSWSCLLQLPDPYAPRRQMDATVRACRGRRRIEWLTNPFDPQRLLNRGGVRPKEYPPPVGKPVHDYVQLGVVSRRRGTQAPARQLGTQARREGRIVRTAVKPLYLSKERARLQIL